MENLIDYLSSKLKINLNKYKNKILIVGNLVRDFLLFGELNDFEAKDIDLVLLDKNLINDICSSGFIFYDKYKCYLLENISLVLLRKEIYDYNNIIIKNTDSLYCDSFRRDFTCNAIYLDLYFNIFWDLFNGIEHLKKKELSLIYFNSFFMDDSRFFRAIRFILDLDFFCNDSEINYYIEFAELLFIKYSKNQLFQNIISYRAKKEIKKIKNIFCIKYKLFFLGKYDFFIQTLILRLK